MPHFRFLETRARTSKISWFFIAFGLFLVLLGNELSNRTIRAFNTDVGSFLSSIGTFIAVVALLEWLYDSYVKHKFFEEIMATRSLFDCGIVEAFSNSAKVNYSSLIAESNVLTLMFAHSKRFLDTYHDELVQRLRSRKRIIFYCNHPASAACDYYKSCGRDEHLSQGEYRRTH